MKPPQALCVICNSPALDDYVLPNGLHAALCGAHQPNAMNAQKILTMIRDAMKSDS